MIFRQFFDSDSFTYTYLLATKEGGDALLIDPVQAKTDFYLNFLAELSLTLRFVVDTHLHADHITATGLLKQKTNCKIAMSHTTLAQDIDIRLQEGDCLSLGAVVVETILTPGHTPDSLCLKTNSQVFTGDTLFIRGTGRTDFQHGDAAMQYDSLFNKLLSLDDDTLVYPGHDYRGATVSTIGEERRFNPRLQVASCEQYVALMTNLNLPKPKLIDIAIPANEYCGLGKQPA